MRRFICVILTLVLALGSASAFASNDITLRLDGKLISCPVAPMIVNDRTMVPFRVIFEALGIDVEWSDALKKVYAIGEDKTIILTIGSDKMLINADIHTLDAPPFISDGHTLVPARAVCEALDCVVGWDGENREVVIRTKDYVPPVEPENPETPENPGVTDTPVVPENPGYTPVIDDDPAYINKNNTKLPQEVIDLINKERLANDLAPLALDVNVAKVAYEHSKDMATYDYIDHTSPSGLSPFDRLDLEGIYYITAAENIGSGFITAEDVVKSWMNSESHRDNILNFEFTHIGVGYYFGGPNGTYWTLMLISR